jgi:hypothetical protein
MNDPLSCPHCGADAVKLRLLADYFDTQDRKAGCPQETEVQDDLCKWADNIVEELKP